MKSTLKNNKNDPMHSKGWAYHMSPRCLAKTRSGSPCMSPRTKKPDGTYNSRCRMHGGAKGSGPKIGNSNALKTGEHTKVAIKWRESERRNIKEIHNFLNFVIATNDYLADQKNTVRRIIKKASAGSI